MRTISIMNLKGGTGKTVTAINLAADLSEFFDAKVLLADADSQASLTEFVSMDGALDAGKLRLGGMADLLRGLDAVPEKTTIRNCQLLGADSSLIELDVTAAKTGVADPDALRRYLAERRDHWDYAIIDCPPAFSAAAVAALMSSDEVVIPMKLDAFGIRGMGNLLQQVRSMRKLNPGLMVAGILPTMYYKSAQLDRAEEMLRNSGLPCFRHIRRSPMVDDSTFIQRPLIRTSPRSGACQDYRKFVTALVGGGAEYGV